MSVEFETIGAASGSSAFIAILVVIIRDLIKNRNGGSGATRKDITDLSTKLSSDISGVYTEIKGLTKGCYDRHLPIGEKLAEHGARLDNLEKQ